MSHTRTHEIAIPELTQDLISETMQRTEARHCPLNERCFVFPHPPEEVRASCDPHHRCRVDWMLRDAGRASFEILLDLTTGLARLWRHPD